MSMYPQVAGWKGTETSREAAESIGAVSEAQQWIIILLRKFGPMTPDEIAQAMGMDKHFIRSRCSELKGSHILEATGERRANASGRKADVLKISQ